MRRFFLPPGSVAAGKLYFRGAEARYLARVLRLRPGETITAFDSAGREYRARLDSVSAREAEALILDSRMLPPRPFRVILAPALLKGQGCDLVLRQAVELGIDEFAPVVSGNCVARPDEVEKRVSRWRRIAASAARQSGQARPPLIRPPLAWEEFTGQRPEADLRLLAWEEESEKTLFDLLGEECARVRPKSFLLLTGPEGGFGVGEVEAARACGFRTVSLGSSTLRATTAPLVLLAGVHLFLGRGGTGDAIFAPD